MVGAYYGRIERDVVTIPIQSIATIQVNVLGYDPD